MKGLGISDLPPFRFTTKFLSCSRPDEAKEEVISLFRQHWALHPLPENLIHSTD